MVVIDYFRYIWCVKSGRTDGQNSHLFSCAAVSLNLSVYMLAFGIITIITGIVVREVSSPITDTNLNSMESSVYRIGTIVLIFGSICVWFGFILLGCAIIRFNCSNTHLSQNINHSIYSVTNNNFIEMNSNSTLSANNFDWNLERPPPYSPPQSNIIWSITKVIICILFKLVTKVFNYSNFNTNSVLSINLM